MGCCGSKYPDEMHVFDALRIRFQNNIDMIHLNELLLVGISQERKRNIRGKCKKVELIRVLMLLIADIGSNELKQFATKENLDILIDLLCLATNNKGLLK